MRKLIILSFALGLFCSCSNDDNTEAYSPESLSTSVFVASDRHEGGSGNNLKGILSKAVNDPDAIIPSVVLLGGDYVSSSPGAAPGAAPGAGPNPPEQHDSTAAGSTQPMPSGDMDTESDTAVFSIKDLELEIDSAMAGHQCTRLFTYGSHDRDCSDGYGAFFSGPYEADGYHIYGISYAQMIYDSVPDSSYTGIDMADARGCCAREATKYFDGWVSGITDKKPIIIMSHVPIHVQRKDNEGGERWYQSITSAAANHDILLLFCHNHTEEEHDSTTTEQKQYLLIPGDSIITQGPMVKNGMTIVSAGTYGHTLNFYYANAGYLKMGYGSLLTFRRSKPNGRYETMTIQRYSITDPAPTTIGATGKSNPYTFTLTHK